MLNCLKTPPVPNLVGNFPHISVMDRKRHVRFKWDHEASELYDGNNQLSFFTPPNQQVLGFSNFVSGRDELEVYDPKLRWPESEMLSEAINAGDLFQTSFPDCTTAVDSGKQISKKRKTPNPKIAADDDETREISEDNSKKSEVVHQRSDYIHVRARRGQATDSHSLAERVRRERISERMKYLQDLVPGCNKITGKAGMLDEIINYVQSLQKQVELLSMKLASVNPGVGFDTNNFFEKEEISTTAANFACNPMQQVVTSEFEPQLGFQPIITQPFVDTSCFTHPIQATPTWDAELHNLYNEDPPARPSPFPPQTFPDC